jgi:hypothetical protein
MKKSTILFAPIGENKSKEILKAYGERDTILKAYRPFSDLMDSLFEDTAGYPSSIEKEAERESIIILMARVRIALATLQSVYDPETIKSQQQLEINAERVVNALENQKVTNKGGDNGRESNILNYR